MIGKRNQQTANLLLERVAFITDEQIPFFTSDQLPEYRTALLHTYGVWYQPQRNGDRGRYPKPRLVPHPGLLYAQVVKVREKGRVVEVRKKVVFGDSEVIDQRLAQSPVSNTVNTSFVDGRLSYFDLHYLIGTPEGTDHYVERHELGLFEVEEMRAAFADAGLEATYDEEGLTGRGLYIGCRPR